MDNLNLIERYIKNRLDERERADFEKRLQNDLDFKKEYEDYLSLITAIESQGLKNSLKGRTIPNNDEAKVVDINHKPNQNFFSSFLKIAASFTILFIAGYFLYNNTYTEERFISENFYSDPGLPTKMGITENYVFIDGMVDYKNEKYEVALNKWSSTDFDIGKDTVAYYKAMAHINLKNLEEAGRLLNTIEPESNLFEKTQWKQVEVLTKQKKYQEALSILQSLPPENYPNYEEVKSFLSKR